MARDIREEILVRLKELLSGIEGAPAEAVYRNRPGLVTAVRPCALLLDAVETKIGTVARRSGRGGEVACAIMELKPEIFYAHLKRKPDEHELVGPEMSASRMAVLAAIMTDATLAALCGPNGGVDYYGFETDQQNTVIPEGVTQYFFSFRYVLDPAHLT